MATAVSTTPVMTTKAKTVGAALTQAGLTGFDPSKIIQIITALIAMFAGCAPVLAARRMRNFGRGQWYLGCALDMRSLNRIVEGSGVLTGDGDNPATLEDVVAAVKDSAGAAQPAEVSAMMAEHGE